MANGTFEDFEKRLKARYILLSSFHEKRHNT